MPIIEKNPVDREFIPSYEGENTTASEFTQLIDKIEEKVRKQKTRSAWDKGVTLYELELIRDLREYVEFDGLVDAPKTLTELENLLLNGARDWDHFSAAAMSLVANHEIAERLCTPSELKMLKGGAKTPRPDTTWIEVQAGALFQAAGKILEFSGLDDMIYTKNQSSRYRHRKENRPNQLNMP